MNAVNRHLLWAQHALGWSPSQQRLAASLLHPLGQGARNDPQGRRIMRELDRGGLLDVHQNETGLTALMAPGSPDRSLIRLGATVRSNPRVVTIGMNVETQVEAPPPAPATDFLLQAVITWGTGKGFSRAVIDLRRGIQFTLTANVLNVDARYVGTRGPTVQISASSAYGNPQGSDVALTFTEAPQQLLTATLGPAFRIPAYATRVSWFANDAPLVAPIPTATIQQRGDADAAGRIVSQTASIANELVPVTNGSDFIRLFNNSASTRTYGLLYELHL